ncbi:MAG: TIGR04282 family arsenosugar biosynthesis glycosyltransferase [Ignavibacteriales bacterium]|nr:TIGR04282 family arsenosugar biosynthesis glycosyltransferase [Ignavibacteriales bacterium]
MEIIVSDGGSSDNTIEICKREKVILVTSGKGRGDQLNKGATAANGEILLFLHADTFLPDNAFELLDEFFMNDKNKICRFLLGFDIDHWFLDLCVSFSRYSFPFTQFGDSSIVVRKSFFEKLGGYPPISSFEDVEFFKRAAKSGNISILHSSVDSSSRRFIQNGPIRQKLIDFMLFAGYLLKLNPELMTRFYNKKIKKNKLSSLIVFLRSPRIGKVKTRLAETTTEEFALHFYRECANKIMSEIKRIPRMNKYVFYSDKYEKEEVKKWLGNRFLYSHQDGDDLGTRMKNAFQKVFSHGAGKVVIVGTDIPDLTHSIVENAIYLLNENDVVIGPSKDGGYYLLGMKKMHNTLFDDIEFSTSSVLPETIRKIEKIGLKFSLLPQLQDIDTEAELIHWLGNGNGSPIKKKIDLVYNLINGKIRQRCVHCGE